MHSRTVDSLLVCECLSLLCFIPIDDKTVPERQGSTAIRSSEGGLGRVPIQGVSTHSSSQLNKDRARVVSMWRTVSSWGTSAGPSVIILSGQTSLPRIVPELRNLGRSVCRLISMSWSSNWIPFVRVSSKRPADPQVCWTHSF